jgi:hypothetical protein
MAGDIVADAKAKASAITGGAGSGKSVWLGSGKGSTTSTYSGGVPITTPSQNYSTIEKMQNSIISWGAARSPMYDTYVNKLINGGFMSKTYADQPLTAAKALESAVSMFQSYNGTGGTLGFDDWFDWYSSTGTGGKSGGSGGYSGPVTTTTTTVYDDRAAETVLQKMARETFGRNLTKSEAKRYATELQRAQRDNPSVTRSEGTGASRSSMTTSAVGGDVLAQDLLTAEDEAIDFAAESTGLDQMWNSINRGLDVMYGR